MTHPFIEARCRSKFMDSPKAFTKVVRTDEVEVWQIEEVLTDEAIQRATNSVWPGVRRHEVFRGPKSACAALTKRISHPAAEPIGDVACSSLLLAPVPAAVRMELSRVQESWERESDSAVPIRLRYYRELVATCLLECRTRVAYVAMSDATVLWTNTRLAVRVACGAFKAAYYVAFFAWLLWTEVTKQPNRLLLCMLPVIFTSACLEVWAWGRGAYGWPVEHPEQYQSPLVRLLRKPRTYESR